MERAAALKKLSKLLGKSFRYRVDPGAPGAADRAEAKACLPGLIAAQKQAEEAMAARRKAVLDADPEYLGLVAEHTAAREMASSAAAVTRHFKITVGVVNSMFFHIKAQGDSWEDVIAKLNGGAR
jgi:hypothetical protein